MPLGHAFRYGHDMVITMLDAAMAFVHGVTRVMFHGGKVVIQSCQEQVLDFGIDRGLILLQG